MNTGNIVRTYKAKHQSDAVAQAVTEAERDGLIIVSQSWEPGKWGCGAFVIALLLCLLVVGLLVFLYLLIVKPDGELTVVLMPAPKATAATEGTID
jgi:hypothetical protein